MKHLIRVGFQGAAGANGEAAVAAYWNEEATPVPVRSFDELLAQVAVGSLDAAVVPVWNSTIGDVRAARDAMQAFAARLITKGELLVPVRHALLALPAASLETLRYVGSHPAALAQCRGFLRRHPWIRAVEAWDTAGAAMELARLEGGDDRQQPAEWHAALEHREAAALGAIANASLADRHGLAVLATDIQDRDDNFTRFLVVSVR